MYDTEAYCDLKSNLSVDEVAPAIHIKLVELSNILIFKEEASGIKTGTITLKANRRTLDMLYGQPLERWDVKVDSSLPDKVFVLESTTSAALNIEYSE